jgi:hypothetical protein
MLRGALVQKVNAACPECPMGIDLSQANFSISIFARSLLANCEQVGQIIFNATRQEAGKGSTYDDLWRFTLLNYNAGSGCLANAIQGAVNSRVPLTWDNVIQYLEPGVCREGIDYVDDIAYMPPIPTPTPESTSEQTQPVITSTPTTEPSDVIQPTPTPTPTQPAYPAPQPTDIGPYP